MPWRSDGNRVICQDENFLFRIIPEEDGYEVVRFNQRVLEVYHNSDYLICDGRCFWIREGANIGRENQGMIKTENYNFPDNLDIDNETYLAGSKKFDLKEIEIYQVIGDLK